MTEASNTRVTILFIDKGASRDLKGRGTNDEHKRLEARGVTTDGESTIIVISSTISRGNRAGNIVREDQERGTGVKCGIKRTGDTRATNGGTTDNDTIPAIGVVNRDSSQETLELARFIVTKDIFASTTVAFLAEINTKDRVTDQVIHGGLDASDSRDGIKAKAEETIRGTVLETAGFLSGQFDRLMLDGQTAQDDSTGIQDTTGTGAITIGDGPRPTVLGIGSGLIGVILGLRITTVGT
jgi:hypothetical protein